MKRDLILKLKKTRKNERKTDVIPVEMLIEKTIQAIQYNR